LTTADECAGGGSSVVEISPSTTRCTLAGLARHVVPSKRLSDASRQYTWAPDGMPLASTVNKVSLVCEIFSGVIVARRSTAVPVPPPPAPAPSVPFRHAIPPLPRYGRKRGAMIAAPTQDAPILRAIPPAMVVGASLFRCDHVDIHRPHDRNRWADSMPQYVSRAAMNSTTKNCAPAPVPTTSKKVMSVIGTTLASNGRRRRNVAISPIVAASHITAIVTMM
jgi:hypothetical protein